MKFDRRQLVVVAVVTGLLTCAMGIVAALAGISSTETHGLVARTALVFAAMVVVAVISLRHDDSRRLVERLPTTELTGLCLGWLFNPLSWAGRSFAGQWFTTSSQAAIALDFATWLLAATLAAVVASTLVNRTRAGAIR